MRAAGKDEVMAVQARNQANVSPAINPERSLSTVLLPNGITVPYVEQGDPDGLPVVLLHGFSDSWRSWETVLPHLPHTFHVFAPSQRGHGDADKPASGYRIDDFVADLKLFCQALEIGPALFVGHSLGSAVVQRYALDHPRRVLGLALVASATTWHGSPVFQELWETIFSTIADPVPEHMVREFQESPLLSPERLEVVVGESLKPPARVYRQAWQTLLENDHSSRLGEIQAPALIVWGDQDPLCPRAEQDALLAAIPSSELIVYPGGGHNLHWEEPERFAADLTAFCRRLVR